MFHPDDGEVHATKDGGARQILGGQFAGFAGHQLNIIVFPQNGKDFVSLARFVNAQAHLKSQMIAGIFDLNMRDGAIGTGLNAADGFNQPLSATIGVRSNLRRKRRE